MSYPKSNQLLKPTVLTDKVKASIIQLLAEGNYLSTACLASGISVQIFNHWRSRYEDGDAAAQIHADFFVAVNTATAVAEVAALRNLKQDVVGWQRHAWYLERKFQKKWGKKVQIDDTRDLKGKTDAELEAIAKGKSGG